MIELLADRPRPWLFGHRGAPSLAPENTLRSFEAAVGAGVDGIELDVLALADGTLIVTHAQDLGELTRGRVRGGVHSRTLAELRELEPALPTLDEALAFLRERAPTTAVQLDLKSSGVAHGVVGAICRHDLQDRTLVSSVFPTALRAVGALEPRLALSLTYPFDRWRVSRRRPLAPVTLGAILGLRRALPHRIGRLLDRAGAAAATLHYLVVSRAVVERCHARGAAVLAWTVDDPRVLRGLAGLGIDGIITNDPRILSRLP